MNIYFCRHAVAADAEGSMGDADRPLTKEGTRKFQKAAKGFANTADHVTHILTSPALRARQTAEILEEAFLRKEIDVTLITTPALENGAKLETLLKALRSLKRARDVVLVGHEPALSTWIGKMCGGANVEMKKGAVAVVQWEGKIAKGLLLALMPPKVLRRLR